MEAQDVEISALKDRINYMQKDLNHWVTKK